MDSLRGGLGVGIAGVDIVFTTRGGPLREKVSDGGEPGSDQSIFTGEIRSEKRDPGFRKSHTVLKQKERSIEINLFFVSTVLIDSVHPPSPFRYFSCLCIPNSTIIT